MATRLKPTRINVDNTPRVGDGAAYQNDNDFHWSMGGGDMAYRDFEWHTLTGTSLVIEEISNNITPSSDFTVSAGTVKPGIEYVLRVNTGNTPYTMTLGTGVTNPNSYKTELKPNTVNQFKFIATSTSQLELEGVDSSIVSEINWGEIDGTLSNQTDLQNALDSKVNLGINKVFDTTTVQIGKWEHEPGGDSSGHHIELDPNGEVSTYNLTQAGHNEATLGSGTLELLNNTVLDGNKTATFDHEKIVADDGTNTNTYNFFGNDRIAKLSDLAGKQDALTAGNHIDITNNVISTTGLQEELTAGENITIGDVCHPNTQGPAPDGFHLPVDELKNVLNILTKTFSNCGFSSKMEVPENILKMPRGGRIRDDNGGINMRGDAYYYWYSKTSYYASYGGAFYATGDGSYNWHPDGGYATANGFPIRAFKDVPVQPDNTWTVIYDGSAIATGAGVFYNAIDGLISISGDGTTRYTMMDKNLGATQVYNYGDTLSDSNCGLYYQWGNNHGFPSDLTGVTTSTTLVDVTGYGPGNYYDNDVFIISTQNPWSWFNGTYENLWGKNNPTGTWCELAISATDTKYTAGNGIDIDANNEISIDTSVVATQTDLASKQDTLTAGTGISIDANNEISNTLPGPTIAATAPTGTEGALWYDTTNDVLMAHNGTAWKEAGTQMKVLSYGHSTWQDFLDAYNENAIVYCRASSSSDPSTGSQGRLAFMAYVNNANNPTEVEFQYYRSRSDHNSAANQLDEVYVYKLVPASGGTWTVTQRNTAAKAVAGTGINLTFGSGNMTISADTTVLATQTDLNSKQDTISDLAAIRSGAGLGATAVQPGDNISDLNNDSGYITSSYHDSTKQDKLVSGTNIKTINGNGLLGGGNISIGEAHIMTQSEFDNVGSPKGIYFIYDYLYPTLYITITPNTYQAQVGDTIRFDITRGSNEAIGASTMTSSDGLNSWSSASFDGFTPYITGLTYTITPEDATAGKYVLTLIATETNNPSNTIEVSCVIQVNA